MLFVLGYFWATLGYKLCSVSLFNKRIKVSIHTASRIVTRLAVCRVSRVMVSRVRLGLASQASRVFFYLEWLYTRLRAKLAVYSISLNEYNTIQYKRRMENCLTFGYFSDAVGGTIRLSVVPGWRHNFKNLATLHNTQKADVMHTASFARSRVYRHSR